MPLPPDELDEAALAALARTAERCLAARQIAPPPSPRPGFAGFLAYWRAASASFGEGLALELVADLPIGTFGLMSYSVVSAGTVGDFLEVLARDHVHRMVPGMRLRIDRVDRDTVELVLDEERPRPGLDELAEFLLCLLARRLRELPVEPVRFAAAGLLRPPPDDPVPWRRFFGVAPRFGQGRAFLRFPAAAREIALRTANPALRRIMGEPDAVAAASVAARVRAHLRTNLRGAPAQDMVARALGLSARTLQRALTAEATSFRALVTAVRLDEAAALLERTRESIGAIAGAVGFARVSSFTRAFAARTGLSPAEYRARRQTRRV